MDQWEQAIVDLAGSVLKQTRPYQEKTEYDEVPPEENFQVSYILTKGDLSAPENILAIAACEDETFLFYPLEPRGEPIADWPPVSDHETMLFGTLAEGFDLMMMTPDTHYNVWSLISCLYENGASTDYPEGLKKYLDTCQRQGVTKQFLKERSGYDGMDIMALRDKLESALNEKHAEEQQELGGM